MAKYLKRHPDLYDAIRWSGSNWKTLEKLLGDTHAIEYHKELHSFTLDYEYECHKGDYVVRYPNLEVDILAPSVFETIFVKAQECADGWFPDG